MPEHTIDPASILPPDTPPRRMAAPDPRSPAPTASAQEDYVHLEQLQLRVEQLELHRRNDLRRIIALEARVAAILAKLDERVTAKEVVEPASDES